MQRLYQNVKNSLDKARDAALLAVEVYNKPAVSFKSGGFIVLMVIAWTSLFHAIFYKRKIKPYYPHKTRKGWYDKRDGDYKHWELDECLRQYYKSDTNNPNRKNLEFFIPLRNKIEHRSMPELDPDIFGECQAMLLNFDEMIEKEFNEKYCLRELLSFALQLFPQSKSLGAAIKSNKDTRKIKGFIEEYRSSISSDIWNTGKYSFKAFLIKVANHKSKEALPIQFIHYDSLSDNEKKNVNRLAALIKQKEIPVVNFDGMKPGEVMKKVQKGLGNPKIMRNGKQKDKFDITMHTRCWKKYKVRPTSKSQKPELTTSRYCIYDKVHRDYIYTEEWVKYLVNELKNKTEFESLYDIR